MSNIIKNKDATEGMMKGVKMAVDLIKPTYGGKGMNVIVESPLRPFHGIYNDAWSIVQAIKAKEPAEKIGLDFIKELCERADKLQGDGRKTTLLILDTLLEEGYKSGMNKLHLKRELDDLIPIIEKLIDEQTKPITLEQVSSIATTASESKEIGNLLQEIYLKIGKGGILNVEGSKTYETTYKITDGVRFEMTGMLSADMVYDEEAKKDKRKETKAIYQNPLILITKKKISNEDDINPLLREISQGENKNLVIFTNDMDSNVASMLVGLHKNGGFTDNSGNFRSLRVLVIKAPSLWQNLVFEDFAKCTGATIVEDATGINYKNLQLEHLGTCERLEVDNEDTILTGIKDITEHCRQLQEKGDDDSLLRLSWLATKSAILKLGANSQSDLSYKRLKCNDANRSTYLALQYGVVKGGGLCLADVAEQMPQTEAGSIMSLALNAPLKAAIENYGVDLPQYKEIITEDIVDASKVIKMAVRNAIGIASVILTASALIYIPTKTPEEIAYEIAMKQSNPFGQ